MVQTLKVPEQSYLQMRAVSVPLTVIVQNHGLQRTIVIEERARSIVIKWRKGE